MVRGDRRKENQVDFQTRERSRDHAWHVQGTVEQEGRRQERRPHLGLIILNLAAEILLSMAGEARVC